MGWVRNFFELPQKMKRIILVLGDTGIIIFSFIVAYGIRAGGQILELAGSPVMLYLLPSIVAFQAAAILLKFYRLSLRNLHITWFEVLIQMVVIMCVSMVGFSYFVPDLLLPRSVPILFGLIVLSLVAVSRLVIYRLYEFVRRNPSRVPIVIFGSGLNARQVGNVCSGLDHYEIVGYFDPDNREVGSIIGTVPVFPAHKLPAICQSSSVELIVDAVEESQKSRDMTVNSMFPDMHVNVISGDEVLSRMVLGQLYVPDVNFDPLQLFGRPLVESERELISQAILGKVVLVTGGGGSIGAELCRQVVRAGASKLMILDISEYNLYLIEQEATKIKAEVNQQIDIIPVLGSITDDTVLERAFGEHRIDLVFHAAAYKHVPLVESNWKVGLENNFLGTKKVAEASGRHGVEKFVLISTDKAVRPASIMGLTKRLAELATISTQAAYPDTCFSMVRFGNVIGSSGSVIPLFKQQILNGGPITVTDPKAYRYFMTIPEAVGLVIQSSVLAKGQDVLLLDMGEEVNILDLARKMIEQAGLTEENSENPDGDIRIEFIGLRPGERLHEELLVTGVAEGTQHPKISRSIDWGAENSTVLELVQGVSSAIEQKNWDLASNLSWKFVNTTDKASGQ